MKNKYVFSSSTLDSEKFCIGAYMVKCIGYKLYKLNKDYITFAFASSLIDISKKYKKLNQLRKIVDITINLLVDKGSLVPIKDVGKDTPSWIQFKRDDTIFEDGPRTEMDLIQYDIIRIYYAGNEQIFNNMLDAILEWFNDQEAISLFNEYVDNLPTSYYFNLNKDESRAILISYYLWITDLLDSLWGPLIKEDIPVFMDSILSPLCGKTYKNFNRVAKELLKKNIFSKDYNFCITEEIKNIMELNSLDDIIRQCFDKVPASKTYDLDTFNVAKENVEILKGLFNTDIPLNILIYGSAGTGKTEFTKTLALSQKCPVYIFNHSVFNEQQKKKEESGRNLNYLEYLNLILSLGMKDKILIIDEADRILSTAPTGFSGESNLKSFVNQMLDNNRCKVIWITNNVKQIDTSTKRRFTYSLFFNHLKDDIVRRSIEKEFKSLNLKKDLQEKLITTYLKYDTTMASLKYVKNIISNVSKMKVASTEEGLLKTVKNVLSSNQSLLERSSKRQLKIHDSNYSLDVLNTDSDVNTIIDMVKNALIYREKNPDADNSVKILFYGLPGTGKTALATYIADSLGKELLKMHTSDILSKWVGESEANIRKFLQEAESSDRVLLIDEVDSFVYNRDTATRSWERTQVNEFLTQMDDYKGILICTTNLLDIVDPAIKRRYHILVKFNAMNEKGIKVLCNTYFKSFNISNEQIKKIAKYDTVTPADFSTLFSRVRFINESELTSDYITDELCKIQETKDTQKKIGFQR